MKIFIGTIVSSLLLVLVVSCSDPKPPKYPVIDEDFCSKIHVENGARLSDQLAGLDSLMMEKTGVYTLEEGDISMISRAWLTGAAEQTIDIQYFIFSADNVVLIAADYLLRAADRGVKIRVIVDDIKSKLIRTCVTWNIIRIRTETEKKSKIL